MRLYLILFWLFVAGLLAAMGQNVYRGETLLSNDVFVLMAICVVLVLCDEVTKHLNSRKRISEQIREELKQEGWRRPDQAS